MTEEPITSTLLVSMSKIPTKNGELPLVMVGERSDKHQAIPKILNYFVEDHATRIWDELTKGPNNVND